MIKGIIFAALVIILAVGGYLFYKQRYPADDLGSGDVVSRKVAPDASDSSSAATTDLDGTSNGALPTPSRSDAPGTVNGDPVAAGNQLATTSEPGASGSQTGTQTGTQAGTMHAPDSAAGSTTPLPTSVPVADSIAPNPPNGTIFGGIGAYQWYRQGNLTWRVDSKSGYSCIAFATMEEWQKSIVVSHGCGRTV